MRNYFPNSKRPSAAPLHTLSISYDVPAGFVAPPPPHLIWGSVLRFICGRRRVAVARYRMIFLVFVEKTPEEIIYTEWSLRDLDTIGDFCLQKLFDMKFY